MSESDRNVSAGNSRMLVVVRWVPPLVLLLGFPFALYYLSKLNVADFPELSAGRIAGAGILYFFAVWFLVQIWKCLLRWSFDLRITTAAGMGHVGMTLIGKFLPGKIWGFLSRGIVLKQSVESATDVAVISVAEQLLFIHGGLLVATVFGSAYYFLHGADGRVLIAALVLLVVSIWFGARTFSKLHVPLGFVARKLHSPMQLESQVWSRLGGRHYVAAVMLFACYWIIQCLVVVALCWEWYVDPGMSQDWIGKVLMTLTGIPLAVVAGFVVLWVPSGIGVREGIIVGVLVSVFGLNEAVGISLVYRIWCVCWDLILGGWALFYFRLGAGNTRKQYGKGDVNSAD